METREQEAIAASMASEYDSVSVLRFGDPDENAEQDVILTGIINDREVYRAWYTPRGRLIAGREL